MSACGGDGSNGRDSESREVKGTLFSPYSFPLTLMLLRILLHDSLFRILQTFSCCRDHTPQAKSIPLRIPHGTLNTQHIPSPRHRPYAINCPGTPKCLRQRWSDGDLISFFLPQSQ